MTFSDGELAPEERSFLIKLRMALDLEAERAEELERR